MSTGSESAPRSAAAAARLTEAQQRAVAELLHLSPVIDALGERFASAGEAIALVGGSVRDALLGRLGDDLDFTTSATPERVLELVAGWADAVWEVGIAFGTVGITKDDYRLEITTYRSESYDRASRKPEVTYGDSLEADLVRRDFTVNAMAVALPGRTFVDPYGGLVDLGSGVLRTPATPEESFSDDPLRMMRAARFASQLGFDVAPEVVAAMVAMAERIDIVSAERVQAELVKLVCGLYPREGLALLVESGLAAHVLPELPLLKLEIDEHHRHKDVYEHTLIVLEQAIDLEDGPNGDVPGPDFVLRFAALMHDVGKPRTRRFESGGGVSFHHHEVVGAKLTRKRMQALKFSNELTDDVSQLVELHLRFHGYGNGEWTDSAVRRYVRDAGPLLSRLHKLTRADCTTRNQRRAALLKATYDSLEERIERLAEEEGRAALRPSLDGTQIMAILGVPPGRVVGRAYAFLMELRLDRGPLEPDVAEAELRAWWAEQPESREP